MLASIYCHLSVTLMHQNAKAVLSRRTSCKVDISLVQPYVILVYLLSAIVQNCNHPSEFHVSCIVNARRNILIAHYI